MSADTSAMQAASIRDLCKPLRLPTVAAQAVRLAEQAAKERQSPLGFLEALLSAEVEEREQNAVARRIKDAHFPKVKALEDFDFQSAPHLPATLIRQLSEGGYIGRTEPVLFLGEAGTGKTHLAIGLAVAACRQRKRVRFTTATEMVNELVDAIRTAGHRRDGVRGTGGGGGRDVVPGHRREGGKGRRDRHHELALLRVDDGLPKRAPV
jgi:DNA replication protein DnaC